MKKLFALLLILVLLLTTLPTVVAEQIAEAKIGIDVSAMSKEAQKAWNDLFVFEYSGEVRGFLHKRLTELPNNKGQVLGYYSKGWVLKISGPGAFRLIDVDDNVDQHSFGEDDPVMITALIEKDDEFIQIYYYIVPHDGAYINKMSTQEPPFQEVVAEQGIYYYREYLRLAESLWTMNLETGEMYKGIKVTFTDVEGKIYKGIITSENFSLIMRPDPE